MTLTGPDTSVPALIKCVIELEFISGYKVSFEKSVKKGCSEPDFVKPFYKLYAENINPLIKRLKENMARWKNLPMSFLCRINLIKLTILPKIIYPVSMLFVILRGTDRKPQI